MLFYAALLGNGHYFKNFYVKIRKPKQVEMKKNKRYVMFSCLCNLTVK